MADKLALVVGASRGLGLGLVRELAGRGWSVIATVRDPGGATELRTLADQSAGRVRIEALEINDEAGVDRLAGSLSGETLDLLFVNAGISGPQNVDALRAPQDEIAHLFLTNSVAPIRLAWTLKDRVREGSGVIAFMSSGLGSVGGAQMRGGLMLYKASKAALNSLVRSFTLELEDRKLTVLALSPGWVRTDMGGAGAPLSVEQSVKGVIDVVEAKAGTGDHGFYGQQGQAIPW
jgi:NAD(P)-dependent dehydrogenase (short-subunit alcohol dehydrogenase family)